MKRKTALAAVCAALVAASALAADDSEPPRRIFSETEAQKAQRMAWWTHDRFGMFIRFGLYAVPARHEWVKSKEGEGTEFFFSLPLQAQL